MYESVELTDAQKARIERNRLKALTLKNSKLVSYPYTQNNKYDHLVINRNFIYVIKFFKNVVFRNELEFDANTPIIKVQGTKYVDSGGGFLIEQPVAFQGSSTEKETGIANSANIDTINIPVHYEECLICNEKFAESFLSKNFDYNVCDICHDPKGAHSLITRTEAKSEYLLKDCDFDKREPPLKCIKRKNPHNVRWGEMKLYLHLQVQQRASEVWGSDEHLLQQHENRLEKREVSKIRKYNKEMKRLRMEVRSSLYTKAAKGTHVHDFGEDTYNEADDTYTHACTTCSYSETYEKM